MNEPEKVGVEVRRHDLGGWYTEVTLGDETKIFRDPDPVEVVKATMAWIEERGTIHTARLIDGIGLETEYSFANRGGKP
jgi:hypothetical protein